MPARKKAATVTIEAAARRHFSEWWRLRIQLWPKEDRAGLQQDMTNILKSRRETALLAVVSGKVIGFVDVRLRDVAEGATTSPVGYLEGWYVIPRYRRQGIGRTLVKAAEAWAKRRGATEMGSDTWLPNIASQKAHTKLGYTEVERLVAFHKKLR